MGTKLWALCLGLAGCGSELQGRYQLELHDETGPVSVEAVDAVVDAVLAYAGGKGRNLRGLPVYIEKEALPLNGAPGPCLYPPTTPDGGPNGKCAAGLTYEGLPMVRVWKQLPCFARSAFAHELCHVLQWQRQGADDPGHSDPYWWDHGAGTSVEEKAQHAAIMAACPDAP